LGVIRVAPIDFLSQFTMTGQVFGVGLQSGPAEWDGILGADDAAVTENSATGWRTDYGIVEVSFHRVGNRWECYNISIQTHRLQWGRPLIEKKLSQRYGSPFPVGFDANDLLAAAENSGTPLQPEEFPLDAAYDKYLAAGSQVTMLAKHRDADENKELPDVYVWQLNANAGRSA
jgi:hypothetical protein